MSGQIVRIMAVGDICPGDHYFTMGHGVRSNFEKAPDGMFANVADLLKRSDITFCNLEGVISDSGLDRSSFKSFAFRGNPRMSQALRAAGFNVANVANNHIMQHGVSAFEETVTLLRGSGIQPLGLKSDSGYSSRPVIVEVNKARVGMLGYSMVPERYCPDMASYAMSSPDEMKNDVRLLRRNADFVILSCHCGIEALDYPSPYTRELARSLIDCGADVFIGHHPHVFQPVELYKNGAILYSLGNFLSDFFWDDSFLKSGIAEIKMGGGPAEVQIHRVSAGRSCQPRMDPVAKINCKVTSQAEPLHAGMELANLAYYSNASKASKSNNYRKNIFFLRNLMRGRTRLKLSFLFDKLKR